MKRLLQGRAGQLEIAAHDPAVVPGVVRIKAGPGLLFSVFLSADEAQELGHQLGEAAAHARCAAQEEKRV